MPMKCKYEWIYSYHRSRSLSSYLSLFSECNPLNGPLTSHHSFAILLNFWISSSLSVDLTEYFLIGRFRIKVTERFINILRLALLDDCRFGVQNCALFTFKDRRKVATSLRNRFWRRNLRIVLYTCTISDLPLIRPYVILILLLLHDFKKPYNVG